MKSFNNYNFLFSFTNQVSAYMRVPLSTFLTNGTYVNGFHKLAT